MLSSDQVSNRRCKLLPVNDLGNTILFILQLKLYVKSYVGVIDANLILICTVIFILQYISRLLTNEDF